MPWEVAIIVDPHYNPHGAGSLTSDMPIWIVDTPENRSFAEALWTASKVVWLQEPVCTTFRVSDLNAREENCLNILRAVNEHHPNVTKLHFVGVQSSSHFKTSLKAIAFVPFKAPTENYSVFVRPITSLAEVPKLQLDAQNWKDFDDVFESLFTALGSPAWHGKNFNALHDSIVTGEINTVEVPYILNISGISSAKPEARQFVDELVKLIRDFESDGCPVSIQVGA